MKRALATIVYVAALLALTGASVVWAAPEQGIRLHTQAQTATILLTDDGWSDPAVGTWDAGTRIATLGMDLTVPIEVQADVLTLDGAGYSITGPGSGNGVTISGRSNVTVRNLTVGGFANGFYLYGGVAVTLAGNTASGNTNGFYVTGYAEQAVLDGNTATGNDCGIYVTGADGVQLTGNSADENRVQGIRLYRSGSHTLTGNTADRNGFDGICLDSAHYSALTDNDANSNGQYGLRVDNTISATLSGNEMSGNRFNFRLQGVSAPEYTHSIDRTNLVGGKPIVYARGEENGVYDASTNAGTVYLVNCSGAVVRDLMLTGNEVGVLFWGTQNSRIENVEASGNSTGIWLRNSSGNTVHGNLCQTNAYHGIWLDVAGGECGNNTLTGNTVAKNGYYGFMLQGASGNTLTGNTTSDNNQGLYMRSASNNRFHNNRVISNRGGQAYVSGGTGNSFFEPKPVGGNYWSNWTTPDADGDGFVDTPYTFTGGQDGLPFAADGSWTDRVPPTTSISFSGEEGSNGWFRSSVQVTLTAVDDDGGSGVESTFYSLDGTNWNLYGGPFTIDQEGVTTVYYRSQDRAGNVEQPGTESTILFDDLATFDAGQWGDASYLPRYTGRPQTLSATSVDGRSALLMQTAEVSPPGDARRGIGSTAIAVVPEMAVEVAFKPVGDLDDLAELWLFNRSSGRYVRVSAVAGAYAYERYVQAQIEMSGQGSRVSGNSVFSLNEWLIFRIETEPTRTVISLLDSGRNTRWSTTYDVPLSVVFSDFHIALSQHLGYPYADTWYLTSYFDYVKVTKTDRTSRSETVKIDRTPPTVQFGTASPEPNAAGWNNTDVTVPYVADDTLSGVAMSEPASPIAVTGEGSAVTGSVTVTDFAGNSATVTSPAYKIDKTPPTVTGVPAPEPTEWGWFNSDVTVHWEATDDLSGVDPSSIPEDTVVSGEGADQSTPEVSVADLAGNTATGSLSGINIDLTPPTLEFGTPGPEPNAQGWNSTDVQVPFTAADELSGLAPDSPASPLVLTTEGTGVSETVTVMDRAGNTTSLASPAANIDKTPPAITAVATTPSGEYLAGAWTNEDVTVSFQCSDELSGVVGEPSPIVVAAEGTHSVQAACSDYAGHEASVTFGPINIDRTPPVLIGLRSPEPNEYGWNNTDVVVTFEASDGLSGLLSMPGPTTVSVEGAGMAVVGEAVDLAGNRVTATVENINIDKTVPTIAAVATTPSGEYLAGTWTNQDVMVSWICGDELSGVLYEPSPVVVTAQGTQSIQATCQDYAGNEAGLTFGPINIDRTPPLLIGRQTPEPNEYGWNNTEVVVTFEASDGLSGLVSMPGATTVSAEGTGMVVIGTAVDAAGNEVTASVTVNIDMTPPVPVITAPQPDEVLGTSTALQFDAVDDASGVVSVIGEVSDGTTVTAVQSGDTLGPGVYILTAEATDAAGNAGNESRSFSVVRRSGYTAGSGYYVENPEEPPTPPNGNGKGKGTPGGGKDKKDPENVNFTFTCRYQGGSTVPSSRWPFILEMTGLSFRSTSYDWLVIDGALARFTGSGRINGAGDYGFAVSVIDGKLAGDKKADYIRVRIWDKGSGVIVYDNEPEADPMAEPTVPVESGRIVVRG